MERKNENAHKVADILRVVAGKPTPKHFTSALILAGGSSTRMGGVSKQFVDIDGVPVVAWTALAFEEADCIHEIIIVAKADELELYSNFASAYNITKPLRVVSGGKTRQESAKCGIDAVDDKAEFVAIHDAARCLITPDMIDRVCHAAYLRGAATLALPAVDTIKVADKNKFIESTPDRRTLWQAQTPQVFNANAYRGAAYLARRDGFEATDDNMLLEEVKYPVKLIEGSRENIKITEPCDLLYAKAVLQYRKEQNKKTEKTGE